LDPNDAGQGQRQARKTPATAQARQVSTTDKTITTSTDAPNAPVDPVNEPTPKKSGIVRPPRLRAVPDPSPTVTDGTGLATSQFPVTQLTIPTVSSVGTISSRFPDWLASKATEQNDPGSHETLSNWAITLESPQLAKPA
jgi:hypothetical protein